MWRMSRLTRGGRAESVARDQVLRRERGQGTFNFPCSADQEQDWQPYPVNVYSITCDYHTFIVGAIFILLTVWCYVRASPPSKLTTHTSKII